MLSNKEYSKKKQRKKVIRFILEVIICFAIGWLLINLFHNFKNYSPYTEKESEKGFITLSYFGIDQNGETSSVIGYKQLRDQLTALKEQGYVTITQQDVIDYYNGGKLPEKALFLMFEDGRRDTAIYAQDMLKDLNYKATMLTYTDNLHTLDTKFLNSSELKDLENSSFWELGTNGNRLEYINVFDRYDRYIGELNVLQHKMMRPYLGRKYQHYVMDYIRDENQIPKESYNVMKSRISYEFENLRDLYTNEVGYVPKVHAIMYANTGRFGVNEQTSRVNEKWIKELFAINFNREGYAVNNHENIIYDLTRMQPQASWSTNHLLMRLKYDNADVKFVKGDESRSKQFYVLDGVSELKGETYILTTMPQGKALVRVEKNIPDNFTLSTTLQGNSFGVQNIYLRASSNLNSSVKVSFSGGDVIVSENGKLLFKKRLEEIRGKAPISIEEDKKNANIVENETFARYAKSSEEAQQYLGRAQIAREKPVKTIAEGSPEYVAEESFHKRESVKLDIEVKDNQLTLTIDGNKLDPISITNPSGHIFLEGKWDDEAWSQRNLADNVYDAVFDKFTVKNSENVVVTTEYTGSDKFWYTLKCEKDRILQWFISHF